MKPAPARPLPIVEALKRGALGQCPNCGGSRLFRAFLKQVDQCAACNEAFGHIRADDGPAWLTILVTGHLLAPMLLEVEPRLDWPTWAGMTFWMLFTLVVALLLLPRAKGMFIAAIWHLQAPGSETPDSETPGSETPEAGDAAYSAPHAPRPGTAS